MTDRNKSRLTIVLLIGAAAIAGVGIGTGSAGLVIFGLVCAAGVAVRLVYRQICPAPYLLEVTCIDPYSERAVMADIILSTAKHRVVSRCAAGDEVVCCIALKLVDLPCDFINRISSIPGVMEARLTGRGEEIKKDCMK